MTEAAGRARYRLAICIPTYNRAEFLAPLLSSLLAQAGSAVQIVVSDNASTDGTQELLQSLSERHPNLGWSRTSSNEGPDRNYLRSVDIADAEYCWLFGSDDMPEPHALRMMLRALNAGQPGIVMCDRVWCDFGLRPLRLDRLLELRRETLFGPQQALDLRSYLDQARTLGALFSYLSSIVVRRRLWNEAGPVEDFVGSAYAHSAKLLKMLQNGSTLLYLPYTMVRCRGDNDFFLEHGVFNRARIDFDGYSRLISQYFPGEPSHALALRVMRREYSLLRLLDLVAKASPAECRELDRHLRDFDYGTPSRLAVRLASLPPARALLRRVEPLAREAWWRRQGKSFSLERYGDAHADSEAAV
jgi:abequosyltransferase